MSNNKYKPRLKKGILKNTRFLVIGKNLRTLKKKKWKLFLKNFINTSLLETLTRNDVSLISNRILRVEKSYSRSLYYKRQLSSFFSTFRGVVLHSFSLETPRIFFLRFLELRADLLLLRAKLVKTLYHARWLIFSGFLFINRTLIRTLSFRLRRGDFLQVRKDNLVNTFFFNLLSFKLPLSYLEVHYNIISFVVVSFLGVKKRKESLKLYSFFFFSNEIINYNKVN